MDITVRETFCRTYEDGGYTAADQVLYAGRVRYLGGSELISLVGEPGLDEEDLLAAVAYELESAHGEEIKVSEWIWLEELGPEGDDIIIGHGQSRI